MIYAPKEVVLTEEELVSLCAEWQNVLALQDWHVRLVVCRRSMFRSEEASGENMFSETQKQSGIKILDHVDYPDDAFFPQDMEETLVHELLHLHFLPCAIDESHNVHEEQAIGALAKAFVAMKRQKQEI